MFMLYSLIVGNMVKIRLSCSNKNKHSCTYAIVATDSRKSRDGAFIEKLGHYHPYLPATDATRLVLDIVNIDKWVQTGAALTERVVSLIKKQLNETTHAISDRLNKLIAQHNTLIEQRRDLPKRIRKKKK